MLKARVSAKLAEDATDEAAEGAPVDSLLQEVLDEGRRKADGILSGRSAPDATLVDAELTFSCYFLYVRRGFNGDANPFASDATATAKRLERIAAGEISGGEGDQDADLAGDEEPGHTRRLIL